MRDINKNKNGIGGKTLQKSLRFKKFNLAFLITTILMISINKSILMIKSTIIYSQTGVFLFEVVNYFILAVGLMILPPLALFFLDSVYVRRLLRFYLFGIIFTDSLEFYEGVFKNISSLFYYERPLNSILLLIEVFSSLYCWLFILRQFNGKSLLPIAIKTKMAKWYSLIKGIKFRIINLKNWILYGGLNRSLDSKYQKRLNSIVFINAIIFSSLIFTMIPENKQIVVERPVDHEMKIWFWTFGPNKLDNTTLDIMSAYNISVKAWGDYKDEEWTRFKDRNIQVVLIEEFPTYEDHWSSWFDDLIEKMDYFDNHPELPFVGFVDDMEHLEGIAKYNSTWYNKFVEFIQNTTNYVKSRGYQFHITQWLASNNDLRDNDYDVSIVYDNPFDPIKMQNISSIDWMVYRSESAILYDEPFEYFTYHWAKNIRNYMEFLEEKYNLSNGTWTSKASMSIGVTKNENSFYTFNTRLNPDAKQQFFKEVLMCHAAKISQITIFIAGRLDNEDGFFGLVGGNEGLIELLNLVNIYDKIVIPYKRRATFFGNLKMLSNITGSIFGLIYSDCFYDYLTGYFVFIWIFSLIGISFAIYKSKKYNVSNKYHKKSEENNFKNETTNKYQIGLRIWFFFSVFLTFFLTAIFFFYPQTFIILENIDIFI
ncbi:MAG: hypothetical protein ACTSRZ_11045 [Promethearchaeota archaeon]